MKKQFLLAIAALSMATSLWAKNTTTTVEQVTQAVALTDDVDYVITSTTPFATAGSVDIQNTEHAVLIFKDIRPSRVIAEQMDHIYINGQKAVDGQNCQVKMFNRGAIVFPYSANYKPLTCYTEENYGGENVNTYTEGHTGGFMKTLSKAQLNNQIKSFKLKRGYMVTFAIGTGGWGYSRCFIADLEDLEIPIVPAPLNGKISSYRLFKWHNASKAGVHHTGRDANEALRTTSCFDWAQGNSSLMPDVEWVPNHIYEDWPSAATCGSVDGSCHMKTNNEPGNSADDHPQSVETVLNNWQNLMRTGMRLCSESSHDGSMNHLKEFMTEIDKRGWRCDILDLHCYWNAGTFNNLNWYSDTYANGRPIWISEWVWGSSWGHNGFWGAVSDPGSVSDANQKVLLDNTKPILEVLNSNPRVERYYYWNSEAAGTHIWHDGKLTKLGEYYAQMETGLAYDPRYDYAPKIVYSEPGELTGAYTKRTGYMELAWSDPNGDMIDYMLVEVRRPGTSRYVALDTIAPKDQNSKAALEYTYVDKPQEAGLHEYRVVVYVDGTRKYVTNETSCTISAANAVGTLQYGQLKIGDTGSVQTDIEPQETAPFVVMGMVSNKNAANGITNQVQALSTRSFKFRFHPWALETPVDFANPETIDYLCLPGDTVYHITDDFMLITQKVGMVKGDEVEVTFPEAFPEGVTPVVVAQQNTSIASYAPVTVKVYDITNTGFKVRLVRQEAATGVFQGQNVNYFAATPGQVNVGGGKMLTVGRNDKTRVGGTARQNVAILNEAGDTLHLQNPTIIAAPQTHNYGKASVFRLHTTNSTAEGVYSLNIRRQVDGTNTSVTEGNIASRNGDYVGWFIVSDNPDAEVDDAPVLNPTALETIAISSNLHVENGVIKTTDKRIKAYGADGKQVALNKQLPAGVYVVTDGKHTSKVVVK